MSDRELADEIKETKTAFYFMHVTCSAAVVLLAVTDYLKGTTESYFMLPMLLFVPFVFAWGYSIAQIEKRIREMTGQWSLTAS